MAMKYALKRLGSCILISSNAVRVYITTEKVSSIIRSLRSRALKVRIAPLAYSTVARAMGIIMLLARTRIKIIRLICTGMNECNVWEL